MGTYDVKNLESWTWKGSSVEMLIHLEGEAALLISFALWVEIFLWRFIVFRLVCLPFSRIFRQQPYTFDQANANSMLECNPRVSAPKINGHNEKSLHNFKPLVNPTASKMTSPWNFCPHDLHAEATVIWRQWSNSTNVARNEHSTWLNYFSSRERRL
jgi:hypothetical protein